jgi:hypothetical protein
VSNEFKKLSTKKDMRGKERQKETEKERESATNAFFISPSQKNDTSLKYRLLYYKLTNREVKNNLCVLIHTLIVLVYIIIKQCNNHCLE